MSRPQTSARTGGELSISGNLGQCAKWMVSEDASGLCLRKYAPSWPVIASQKPEIESEVQWRNEPVPHWCARNRCTSRSGGLAGSCPHRTDRCRPASGRRISPCGHPIRHQSFGFVAGSVPSPEDRGRRAISRLWPGVMFLKATPGFTLAISTT
jgi:hypothetical protein